MPGKGTILLDLMTKKGVDGLQNLQQKNNIRHNTL